MADKKILSTFLAGAVILACALLSACPTQAATKTIKELVVKSTDDNGNIIKAVKNGHTYTIDATTAKLKKAKTGNKTLQFSDIDKGDVLNIKGSENDYDVTATEVRDLSTTKSAVFYGIVQEINTATRTVKIATLKRGTITIAVLSSTKVSYDGKKRAFADIREDDKVLVTGTWNHSKKTITKTKKFAILVKEDYDKLD